MELQVITPGQMQATGLEVSSVVFEQPYNEPLIHEAVVKEGADLRQGSHKQLSRAEVSGGNKKPWKQKGTGRARCGTTRGPLWRTGGVTFAARPGSYKVKMNKKAYKAAMRSILSELVRQQRLFVIDTLELATHKTKDLIAKFKSLNLDNVLVVIAEENKNVELAARNIPTINVRLASEVGSIDLVGAQNILMTVASIKHFEERLVK